MTRRLTLFSCFVIGAGLLAITGCQPAGKAATQQTTAREGVAAPGAPMPAEQSLSAAVSELDRLVATIQERHIRPFKKQYRDERDRAMKMVATKTDALLARMNTSNGPEAALTGTWSDGQHAPTGAPELRTRLLSLNQAARQNDADAVASSYAKFKKAYQTTAGAPASTN